VTVRKLRLPDEFLFLSRQRSGWRELGLYAVLAPVPIAAVIRGWAWYVWLPLAFLVMIADEAIVERMALRRAKRLAGERAAAARPLGVLLETSSCPHCDGSNLIDYGQFAYQHRHSDDGQIPPMRCPRCNAMQLRHDAQFLAIA
jgi:hypothetical protein